LTIRYSIAVDGPPRFRRQALGWLATGAALGGVTADQVLVQCTDVVPDTFRRTVARVFGVEVTALPGGTVSRGTLNKLSQLAHPALDHYCLSAGATVKLGRRVRHALGDATSLS
jgi:hypothetical protein